MLRIEKGVVVDRGDPQEVAEGYLRDHPAPPLPAWFQSWLSNEPTSR